jgi:hypothetical protein
MAGLSFSPAPDGVEVWRDIAATFPQKHREAFVYLSNMFKL